MNQFHLDSDKKEMYWNRGWTVIEGVFDADEIDPVIQIATELCEHELSKSSSYYLDQDAKGQLVAPRKLDLPFLSHPDLRRFVLDGRLRSLIEQFIGAPPLLVQDHIFMKPPRFGSAKPYHQDNAYFLCHPDDEVLTAWIALDDVNETNGCLRYIEGSHRGPILKHHKISEQESYNQAPAAEEIDLSREVLALVKKGGVVFHHSKTLHTSHRNESDQWRRAYATHWASAGVVSKSDTIKNAYYNCHSDLYHEALGN